MDECKKLEDKWGQSKLKMKRPDLRLDKQWTNRFGEYLVEEMLILLNKNPRKPRKQRNFQPDLETAEYIYEVKTQTYYTSGTAGEKIMGVPHKYAELPELYHKPIQIVCIGGAEVLGYSSYHLYKDIPNIPEAKKRNLEYYERNRF
jgi:hypothetical protein